MNDKPNEDPQDETEPTGQPEEGGGLWQLLNAEGSLADPNAKEPPAAPPLQEQKPAPKPAPDPKPAEPSGPNPWDLEAEWRLPEGEAVDSTAAVSQLRQILDAPENLADDFEYQAGPLGAVGEDFDSAIQAYIRGTDTTIKCRKHPTRDSVAQCPECQAYYCQECMTIRRGRMLCRDCAETSFVASEEQILSAHEQGIEDPGSEVIPESPPEFQVGAAWMGLENEPANPGKLLGALLIDFLVTRGTLFLILLIFNALGTLKPAPFAAFFDPDPVTPLSTRLLSTFILMRPLIPWLPLFIGADFIYYFLSLAFTNRTLGMSLLSCRIVTQWGEFVPFGTVALRTVVFMVLFELPATLLAFVFPNFRGPHDMAAGTLVINYAGVKRVDAYETVQIKI